MSSDFVVESTIARMQQEADAARQEIDGVVARLNKLKVQAEERTFTGTSENTKATAEVTGSGKLVNLVIAPVDRSRYPADNVSADVTAAILAARRTAEHEVGKRAAKILDAGKAVS